MNTACNKCKQDRPVEEFRYHAKRAWREKTCIHCERESGRLYNKSKARIEAKQRYRASEKGIRNERDYRRSELSLAKQRARHKRREAVDPGFKLGNRMRTRIRLFLKGSSFVKQTRTEALVGCSWQELRSYIEAMFKPGMSWENYGEWHIDHILPLSSFNLLSQEDLAKASHYSNLQPLWAKENLSKKDKILDLSDKKLAG